MDAVDTFTIDRNGRTYEVAVHVDESPSNPRVEYDHSATQFYITSYGYSRWDEWHDELDGAAGNALRHFVTEYRNAGNPDWREKVARAFHLWTVITQSPVVLVTGSDYGYSQGDWHYWCWFALVDTAVLKNEGYGIDAAELARIEADEYAAYAYGDVFGVVVSLGGSEIDDGALWGIVDRKGDYTRSVAAEIVDDHESWLVREANRVGAGFVGVL
jgi:hypothetical protein